MPEPWSVFDTTLRQAGGFPTCAYRVVPPPHAPKISLALEYALSLCIMPMHNSYNHYVMILYKDDFDPVRHRWCPADVARVTGGLLPLHVMAPPGRGRDALRGAYTDGVPAITCAAVGCRDGLSDGSRASVAADAAGGDPAQIPSDLVVK